MAKTLLDGVNQVLVKVGSLNSDAGLLSSLTDSARQTPIDVAIQSINETIDDVYLLPGIGPKPNQLFERSITLCPDVRAYSLHDSLIRLREEFDFYDSDNNHTIVILRDEEDAYRRLIKQDPEQDDTGLPSFCAIRPTDAKILFDRTPTDAEEGNEYLYRFDSDMGLTVAADEFGMTDPAFRALVVSAAEIWKLHRHREFSQEIYNNGLGRCARLLSRHTQSNSWMPQSFDPTSTDSLVD